MGQEEEGASERGVETPSKIGRFIPAGTEGDRDPERDGKKENWRGERDSEPGDLLNSGIKPGSPALQADSLPSELPGKSV